MARKVLDCPKCDSKDIDVLDPDKILNSRQLIVRVNAKCEKCKHEFTYPAPTEWGKKWGVLY